MSKTAYPVLCGGTFFTLLLEARQARSGKKEQLYGKKDGLSEPETLAGLLRVMYPEYKQPSGESVFRTNTSDYKTCKNNGGNLPFFGQEISAFDKRVKSDYQAVLVSMCAFVKDFIEVGGSVKRDEWLVKALIDLIDSDQSVMDTDAFYVCEDGQPLTKTALRLMASFCFPAFLLGVWHFAIVCRADNTVGCATFNEWCPQNNRKPRTYTGTMGEKYADRNIVLTMPAVDKSAVDASATTIENGLYEEYSGETYYEEQPKPNPKPTTINQTINAPAVFFNSGANVMQINNTGTINIDRGGKA